VLPGYKCVEMWVFTSELVTQVFSGKREVFLGCDIPLAHLRGPWEAELTNTACLPLTIRGISVTNSDANFCMSDI